MVQNVLDSELRRLLHIKAHLKTIIFYPPKDDVGKSVRLIAEGIMNQDIKAEGERWLIVTGSGDVRDRKGWKELSLKAFEIENQGAISEIGKNRFDVTDIVEEG